LAARALLESGGALENLGQPKEAARLYAELVRAYPDQAHAVAEAEARLRGMGGRE
jgi:TolA-binding protein